MKEKYFIRVEIRQYQWNCEEVSKRPVFFAWPFFYYARGKKHMNTNKVSISDYTFQLSQKVLFLCERRVDLFHFEMLSSLSH